MSKHDAQFRVLIAGGGIAGVEALMALDDLTDHGVAVEMLAPNHDFVLRPQLIGAPWGGAPLRVDLHELARTFGATLRPGSVGSAVPAERRVITTAGEEIHYDAMLVAVGATPSIAYAGVRTVGFGPLPAVLASGGPRTTAIIVPPGCAWTMPAYQFALLVAGSTVGEVTVVTPELLPGEVFGEGPADELRAFLEQRGIVLRTRSTVPLGSDEAHELADVVLALPLLRGPGIVGLPMATGQFIPIDDACQVPGCGPVFAAGDATTSPIKQGGLGAHQAEHAVRGILRLAGYEPPEHREPPTLRGKVVSGADELYLRRVLDGTDPGTASATRLWQPEAAMCAWRLSSWLSAHRTELGADAMGPLART